MNQAGRPNRSLDETLPPEEPSGASLSKSPGDLGGPAERLTAGAGGSARTTIPPRGTAEALIGRPATAAAGTDPSLAGEFGRFRIEKCLGEGAMGAVYLAFDTQLDRNVALKIPKHGLTDSPALLERFYREAKSAATLRNAHICPVHDVGEFEGVHYIVMAYIDGRPLSDWTGSENLLPQRQVAGLVRKVAAALQEAHEKGVVHRDLKPSNIMLDGNNEPIIMDFGLARQMNKGDVRLTQAGAVLGSPAYMSPEQVEGEPEGIGPVCDVYSLGVILYELLTGALPFEGSMAAVLGQILSRDPKPPTQIRPDVDPRLEAVCLRMMAKQPGDRYASMKEVAEALSQMLRGSGFRSTPQEPTAVQQGAAPESTAVESAQQQGKPVCSSVENGGSAERPLTAERPAGGIHLQKWMVWTAVLIVVSLFGITWWMITQLLRPGDERVEVVIADSARAAVGGTESRVLLDGKEIPIEALDGPLSLQPGPHRLEIYHGVDRIMQEDFSVEEGKVPVLNIASVDGHITVNRTEKSTEPAVGNDATSTEPDQISPQMDQNSEQTKPR